MSPAAQLCRDLFKVETSHSLVEKMQTSLHSFFTKKPKPKVTVETEVSEIAAVIVKPESNFKPKPLEPFPRIVKERPRIVDCAPFPTSLNVHVGAHLEIHAEAERVEKSNKFPARSNIVGRGADSHPFVFQELVRASTIRDQIEPVLRHVEKQTLFEKHLDLFETFPCLRRLLDGHRPSIQSPQLCNILISSSELDSAKLNFMHTFITASAKKKQSTHRKRRRSKSDTDSDSDHDDAPYNQELFVSANTFQPLEKLLKYVPQLDEGNPEMLPVCFIYSPVNTNLKSTLIHTLAAHHSFQVVESSSNVVRDTQHVMELAETSQSHSIGSKTTSKSLLLFDHVDLLHSTRDSGFWKTVLAVAQTSKRPIFLTCNSLLTLPSSVLSLLHTRSIHFLAFEHAAPELLCWFDIACHQHGLKVEQPERRLSRYYGCAEQDLAKHLSLCSLLNFVTYYSRFRAPAIVNLVDDEGSAEFFMSLKVDDVIEERFQFDASDLDFMPGSYASKPTARLHTAETLPATAFCLKAGHLIPPAVIAQQSLYWTCYRPFLSEIVSSFHELLQLAADTAGLQASGRVTRKTRKLLNVGACALTYFSPGKMEELELVEMLAWQK